MMQGFPCRNDAGTKSTIAVRTHRNDSRDIVPVGFLGPEVIEIIGEKWRCRESNPGPERLESRLLRA